MEIDSIHSEAKGSNHSLGRIVVVISLLCLVIVWTIIILSGLDERNRREREIRDELADTAQVVSEQTRHVMLVVQLFLRLAEDWMETHPGIDSRADPEFARMVQILRRNMKNQVDIRLVDQQGNIFYIPDPEGIIDSGLKARAWVGDRDYVQVQRNRRTKGFFIGKPIISRVTNLWIIPVSYPLETPNRGIAILLAAIDLNLINSMYETSRPKPDGSILLFRTDGVLLAPGPTDEKKRIALVDQENNWHTYYSTAMHGDVVIPAKSPQTQPTISAWLRSTDFPLVVAVSRQPDDSANTWFRLTIGRIVLMLVVTIVVIILLVYLFRLMHIQEVSRRELETFARIDTLTGLMNRRYFLLRTEEELNRAGRYKRSITIALLDLDHFKLINDKHGHAAGDDVLRAFSRVLVTCLRDSDMVGRVGGEEFVVVMPETTLAQAREICERIRLGINSVQTPNGSLGASIGIAEWKRPPETLPQLLKRADAAMYAAKKAGRNQSIADIELPNPDDIDIPAP